MSVFEWEKRICAVVDAAPSRSTRVRRTETGRSDAEKAMRALQGAGRVFVERDLERIGKEEFYVVKAREAP